MFRSFLRYLDSSVAIRQDFIVDAIYFVAEDICAFCCRYKVVEFHAAFDLLDGVDGVIVFFQIFTCFFGGLEITPLHAFFCAECCLVYLAMWRTGRDAT